MSGHEFWVLVHVLLLVYWLGTDLGVFYVSFRVLDRDLLPATRAAMARVLLALDLAPRVCLVLMLPVGLTLAAGLRLSPIQGPWLIAVWLASLVWLAVVLAIHRTHSAPLTLADGWFRALLAVVLLGAAMTSLAGAGPFATGWLALKVALFAVAVACGLGIRLVLRPFGPALAALLAGEVSDDVEHALARSLRRTYPLVFGIWGAVLAAAALGIAQP